MGRVYHKKYVPWMPSELIVLMLASGAWKDGVRHARLGLRPFVLQLGDDVSSRDFLHQ